MGKYRKTEWLSENSFCQRINDFASWYFLNLPSFRSLKPLSILRTSFLSLNISKDSSSSSTHRSNFFSRSSVRLNWIAFFRTNRKFSFPFKRNVCSVRFGTDRELPLLSNGLTSKWKVYARSGLVRLVSGENNFQSRPAIFEGYFGHPALLNALQEMSLFVIVA